MNTKKQPFWIIVLFFLILSALVSAGSVASTKGTTSTSTPVAARLVTPTAEPIAVASPITSSLLDPETDFPLALSNTWVFQVTRYEGFGPSEIVTTTLVITETVVEVKRAFTYFVARIRRDEGDEKLVAVSPSMPGISPRPSTSSEYWLIVSGNRVYRQENNLDLSNLDKALLKFAFPLRIGATWYQVDNALPRQVRKADKVIVPAGHFDNCFLLQEKWVDATLEEWFCPKVGIVDQKSDHNGRPEGFHQVLLRYQLKN